MIDANLLARCVKCARSAVDKFLDTVKYEVSNAKFNEQEFIELSRKDLARMLWTDDVSSTWGLYVGDPMKMVDYLFNDIFDLLSGLYYVRRMGASIRIDINNRAVEE